MSSGNNFSCLLVFSYSAKGCVLKLSEMAEVNTAVIAVLDHQTTCWHAYATVNAMFIGRSSGSQEFTARELSIPLSKPLARYVIPETGTPQSGGDETLQLYLGDELNHDSQRARVSFMKLSLP